MNINKFQKGDSIVRTEPARPYRPVFSAMGMVEGCDDRSYIGEELIFMGIANGMAYFKRTNEVHVNMFGNDRLSLPLDVFSDGWEHYINPNTLFDSVETIKNFSAEHLEKELQTALEAEDYEKAEEIRKQLKQSK